VGYAAVERQAAVVAVVDPVVRVGRVGGAGADTDVGRERVPAVAGEQLDAFLGKLSGDALRPKAKLSIRLPGHFSPCVHSNLNPSRCRNINLLAMHRLGSISLQARVSHKAVEEQ
jgi:hypothetical protein